MKNMYKISPSLAWQSYDCIDMLFILNRKTRNFYFFRDSGRFIVEHILKKHFIQDVIEYCKDEYDVSNDELVSAIENFVELLLKEGLIYESNSETCRY